LPRFFVNKNYVGLFVFTAFLILNPTLSFGEDDVNSNVDLDENSSEVDELEEPVIITLSDIKKKFVLDGKWSNDIEWKTSSYNGWLFDDGTGIVLRSAHEENYLYFLVDYISDRTIDTNADRAMICLEGNNEKNTIAQQNAYCFIAVMNKNTPVTLQGGGISSISGNFNQIFVKDVMTKGTVSDHKDRYSQVPHASYEFKIPTDLVGRYSEYGLYISVYDSDADRYNSWPRNIEHKNNFTIPSPNEWGIMISPDKSLPEFEFPLLLGVLSFLTMIYFSKKKSFSLMRYP